MLEFEHLIQINDPQQPHIPPLTRAQLWAGLVLRASHPEQFNQSIHSQLERISDTIFIRYLTVGEATHREEVVLVPEQEIHTRIGGDVPGSNGGGLRARSLTRIEEPEPDYLFVRFIYARDSANTADGMNVDEFLKSAYLANDRDAISMIREMVASGWPQGV